jgi:hypothetical protein
MRIRLLLLLPAFTLPAFAYAAPAITEIMYDLEGTDSGREWIEICNQDAAVNIDGWKLFENGTNHGLTQVQGDSTLASNGCAVIADNATTFLSDHTGFSGILLDSSFSLSNTGETLILRNADLADVSTASYTSDLGAAGDGNSLQRSASTWIAASPTPGIATVGGTPSATGDTHTSDTADTSSQYSEEDDMVTAEATSPNQGSVSAPVTPLSADAGGDYSGVVGGAILFKGVAFGTKQEEISGARYVWTFGDGTRSEGAQAYHTYVYPGKYRVILTVSSGFHSGTDTAIADISAANVSIARVAIGADGMIEIKNNAAKELDISGWVLSGNGREFVIPENTAILAQQAVDFSAHTTGISVGQGDAVTLMYPNRTTTATYSWGNKTTALAAVSVAASAPKQTISNSTVHSAKQEVAPVPQTQPVSSSTDVKIAGQEADISDSADTTSSHSLSGWLFGLFSIMVVGIISVFLLKSPPTPAGESNALEKEVALYKIEEEQ